MRTTLQRTLTAILLLLLAACDESKIGSELKPIDHAITMTERNSPDITKYCKTTLFAKRESNTLKWRLVIDHRYQYTDEMIKYLGEKEPLSPSTIGNRNRINFNLKFLDPDDFVLLQTNTSAISSKQKDKESSTVSELMPSPNGDGIEYQGSIQSNADTINRIQRVIADCSLSEDALSNFKRFQEMEQSKKDQ